MSLPAVLGVKGCAAYGGASGNARTESHRAGLSKLLDEENSDKEVDKYRDQPPP